MLARNYMTAEQLDITDVELDALITVLHMLERGELVHGKFPLASMPRQPNEFNMGVIINYGDNGCGTIGCICGCAYLASNKVAFSDFVESTSIATRFAAMGAMSDGLRDLFGIGLCAAELCHRTPAQAAMALRSFLTIGEAHWSEALAVQ